MASIRIPGLLALAPLEIIAERTVLTGTAAMYDSLVFCPGFYRQQNAPDLSKGEYPACAAMTTGYVFRVENEATVYQLQKVGKTGHLTTLKVSPKQSRMGVVNAFSDFCCWAAITCTFIAVIMLCALLEQEGSPILALWAIVRLTQFHITRARSQPGWKGAAEPGVPGDLLVLLSQDRWIRIQGLVDDLKAITSGQWLRAMTPFESFCDSACTMLMYTSAAVPLKMTPVAEWTLVVLLLCSAGCLMLSNATRSTFTLCGRSIEIVGAPKPYARRLDLAKELIVEKGREDWAIRLGMIQPSTKPDQEESNIGPKIM